MDDLKIGVIAAGGRGRLAKHAHKPGEGSRITAICDIDTEKLAQLKEDYGSDVRATTDYREMLEADLDAIFVCSPDFLHEEHALAALDKGVPVYLEKPMAISVESCDRILRKAREHGDRLFVGHNMRYMNIIRKMKELIDHDEIGEVKAVWCRHFISYGGDAYFRDWHADRRYSTGLLLQKGAHDIDLIHWFAGAYTKRVSAFGRLSVYDQVPRLKPGENTDTRWDKAHWPPRDLQGFHPVVDVEDQNVVNLELANGVLASYLQCHFTPDACRNYTIIGTKGRLENIGDRPDCPIFIWNRRTDTYNMVGDKVFRGEKVGNTGHGGADGLIVDNFVQFARGGDAVGSSMHDARMAVAAGCMATESLRAGGAPRDVPALPV
ncbi:Gfo/Idh/MocA family protein [Phycisphaerales bacterium AB-hyl4]|uniref:Gfo/Idh/MocA family protein n=1 Tax=Natronomicrosphaera hydrolytica TaxID=3242702 RepID=A0ABV4U2W8_9BACT